MIELLLTYKYWIIIPLAIFEGPMAIIVCGFLVTLGVLNPLFVYLIMVLGDVIGDLFQYYIGYHGKRFLPYFKITEEKLEKTKIYFNENHKKAVIMSKLVYGVGFTGLIAFGALRIPYKKYFKTAVLVSAVQYAILLVIGILFGHAYAVIEKYLNYYAAVSSIIALVVLLFVFIGKYKKKVGKKINL